MKKTNCKKILLVMLAVLCMLTLGACAKKEEGFQEGFTKAPTQQPGLTVPDTRINTNQELPENYDPESEESGDSNYMGGEYNEMGQTVYAGATPVPLDPIDKPTATPRPELTFTYQKAAADQWGVQFEIPGNFQRDDSQTGIITFTDPTKLDNVNASVTMKLAKVGSDYKLDDVEKDVKNDLKAKGQFNFIEWSTTDCTKRQIMGHDGFYADYRGVQMDGTIVRGRVQMALFPDDQLFTLEYRAPGWFNSSYKNVFDHLRSTLKEIEK